MKGLKWRLFDIEYLLIWIDVMDLIGQGTNVKINKDCLLEYDVIVGVAMLLWWFELHRFFDFNDFR